MYSCQNGENNAKEHVNSRIRETIVHNTEMVDISASRKNKKVQKFNDKICCKIVQQWNFHFVNVS